MIKANSGFVPVIRGHRVVDGVRNFCCYTVYDNKTDFPIVVDGTADECARALNRSKNSFYSLVSRVLKGENKRYSILRRMIDDAEEE